MSTPSPYLQTITLMRSALWRVGTVAQRDQADATLRHWLETTGFPDTPDTLDALAFGIHLADCDDERQGMIRALANLAVLRAAEHRRIGAGS